MLKLQCKEMYKVLHLNNELGGYVIGGAGTYMNELYKYKMDDEGFVHIRTGGCLDDIDIAEYMGMKDIFSMHMEETYKLYDIPCEIVVVQFYEFANIITEEYLKNKKMVYVVHSVPTPEPMVRNNPFGGNNDVKEKFEKLCNLSDAVVCVSEAEKKKLLSIYPSLEPKIHVIYNGIDFNKKIEINRNYRNRRKRFGYIGRTDYRKGILECVNVFKNIDGELHLACPKNDGSYLSKVLACIDAAGIKNKIFFHGWCVEKRKESFFKSIDALIIPSLYEPFGYVALEAMQYGVPVISSCNGGLDEIFENYKYKYNPYDEGELERVINQFINDDSKIIDEQMEIMVANSERFHSSKMIEKYRELWAQIDENRF